MLFNEDKLYHIGIAPGQLEFDDGRITAALICGDPGRVEPLACLMDDPQPLASNREYTSFTARAGKHRVLVMSHGIGGPSTAICVEELRLAGIDTIIRIGTCGGMAMNVRAEDIVVASAAIRAEGTSREYLPVEFPAAADFDVTLQLKLAAERLGKPCHVGVVHCKDSFYGQHSPERMPVSGELLAKWQAWLKGGALASEMETAALFCVSATLGIRAGAVLRCIWNQERAAAGIVDDAAPDELSAARVAIAAVEALLN